MQNFARSDFCDADVVWFDVSMRNPFLLQPAHRLQQVLAKALQQLEVERAILPQPRSQRVLAGAVHQQRGMAADFQYVVDGDDVLVTQLTHYCAFLADAIVASDGIAAVQIGVTDLARTSVPTVEKGMRKDEGIFAGLVIIEALDEASLRGALRQATKMAPDMFGGLDQPEIYQTMFTLEARIADFE